MRTCNRCKKEKSLKEFHKHAYKCKPCACAVSREWSRNNRKRHRETQRVWEAKNPGKSAAYKKKWAKKHRERLNAKSRAMWHSEKVQARVRRYAQLNREKINARSLAKYHADTPYRRRKRSARSRVNDAVLRGVLVKLPCKDCGSRINVQGHHHKGYAQKNWLNVIWLCVKCHIGRHRAEA